jgi:crotonobetaine/carnitine-CoA ligase
VNAQSWSIWTTLGAGGTVMLQPKFSASKFLGGHREAQA